MEPREVFEKRVWEEDQIVTLNDLGRLYLGYIAQYDRTTWFSPLDKFKFLIAALTVDTIVGWLQHGKPSKF